MRILVRRLFIVCLFLSVMFLISGLPAVLARDDSKTEPDPSPSNDDFDNAIVITALRFESMVDVSTATTALDDPALDCAAGSQGNNSVWYAFTPGADMMLNLNTAGSTYDTVLAIWQGVRGSLSPVACNDDITFGPFALQSQLIDVQLSAGVPYFIEVAAYATGEMVLNVGDEPLAINLVDVSGGSIDSQPALFVALAAALLGLSLLSLLYVRRSKAANRAPSIVEAPLDWR